VHFGNNGQNGHVNPEKMGKKHTSIAYLNLGKEN
jgi:hypothetical protein